jgi:hypothetical protein
MILSLFKEQTDRLWWSLLQLLELSIQPYRDLRRMISIQMWAKYQVLKITVFLLFLLKIKWWITQPHLMHIESSNKYPLLLLRRISTIESKSITKQRPLNLGRIMCWITHHKDQSFNLAEIIKVQLQVDYKNQTRIGWQLLLKWNRKQ